MLSHGSFDISEQFCSADDIPLAQEGKELTDAAFSSLVIDHLGKDDIGKGDTVAGGDDEFIIIQPARGIAVDDLADGIDLFRQAVGIFAVAVIGFDQALVIADETVCGSVGLAFPGGAFQRDPKHSGVQHFTEDDRSVASLGGGQQDIGIIDGFPAFRVIMDRNDLRIRQQSGSSGCILAR